MPEILIFIDWFYPGFKAGGPIRSCLNLILHLQNDYQFFIVTRNTDYCEVEPYRGLETNRWLDGPGTSKIMYLSEEQLNAGVFSALIKERNWQAVYLNSFFSPAFTILPLRLLRKIYKGRVIVAPRGMLAPDALALKKKKKLAYLYFARLAGWYKNVIFQATSEHEIAHIKQWFPANEIQFAPALAPYHENREPLMKTKEKGVLNILTVARVAPEKNVLEACRLVGLMRGVVNFTLVGPVYNEDYWNQCKTLTATYGNHIFFDYRGALSNDEIVNLMQSQHVTLLPTLGENFGHTILESLLNAMPVIISDRTPWKNLSPLHGGYAINLHNSQLFVEALTHYQIMDAVQFREAGHGAFEFALEYLRGSKAIEQNKKLFSLV